MNIQNNQKENIEVNIEENIENPKEETKKIFLKSSNYDTIVLAGGSVNTFIILGAIQYAYDNYFLNDISTYIGTSGGSMISYLLIIGYTPIDIIVFICKNHLIERLQSLNLVAMMNGFGALSFLHIYEQLEKMTIEKIGYIPTFKDIKEKFNKNLICVTYNLTEQKTEYISHDNYPNLSCLIAIRMSSNLPLIFENFKYGNSFYVDGGMSNNFAIDIGIQKGEKILGIKTNRKNDNSNITKDSEFNILDYIYKIMFIPINVLCQNKINNICNENIDIITINSEQNMFDFNISTRDKLELFSNGYQQMKEYFEK
jgi:predicted acylesterase/phospholipase RssA